MNINWKKSTLASSLLLLLPLTPAGAAEGSDSFAFVGGNIATIRDYNYQDKSRFGVGADALYLKKVWGGLSLGVNATVTFGLETSEEISFNNGSRVFTGEQKGSLTLYTVSLVLGGISE
ncbi:hypothetical protein [Emcibacter sp.]|uniref:hypothetical protein n=1 Tax=Emcibacter sp. TaxID=1979954 RepID=UPI003A8E44A8